MHIAVVDDDMLFQTIISTQLRRLGDIQVHAFANGQEAWQFLQQQSQNHERLPEVMLIDLNMPIMDGWELLRAISDLLDTQPGSELPRLYIVTSSIDRQDQDLVVQYPFVSGFVSKPLSRDVLKHMLTLPSAS